MKQQDLVQRWDVISELLGRTKGRRFLEIGVQRGRCSAHVQGAAEKWGVDPAPERGAERHYKRLFRMGSDDFFSKLDPTERFEVILVDGLHHADQVLRDVDNALRHLSDGGFIVMHDCSPQNELAQRVPRMVGVWNGDCWKAMVELRKRDDVIAFTIDSDHGVGVVRRGKNPAPLVGAPAMDALSYTALERNRSLWLNLTPARRWEERIPALQLGKVVLVSAIFGGRDEPVRLRELDVDEAVMFTDDEEAPGWRTVKVPLKASEDPRRAARRVKALALDLVEGDVVVWVDGRIAPTGSHLRALLRRTFRTSTIASYPHPWRRCAYDEARECAALGLAPKDALGAQVAAYREAGFPAGAGLWNTMVVARRRTDATVEFGRDWWRELEQHTLRDQVSFPYVLWESGLTCAALGQDVYAPGSSPYFSRGMHRRDAATA